MINNTVPNSHDAQLAMSKPCLIGFTEAEGSFCEGSGSDSRIVHVFTITQKLDPRCGANRCFTATRHTLHNKSQIYFGWVLFNRNH